MWQDCKLVSYGNVASDLRCHDGDHFGHKTLKRIRVEVSHDKLGWSHNEPGRSRAVIEDKCTCTPSIDEPAVQCCLGWMPGVHALKCPCLDLGTLPGSHDIEESEQKVSVPVDIAQLDL